MEQEIKILEAIKKGFKPKRGLKSSTQTMGEFFKVNDRKLNALIEATQNDFNKAERAVLRMAEDQYRQVIYNAQVYANTGAGTYEQAVDMATKDFLSRGINCIQYANGARHTISDYADMAIKTAAKRAYLVGEGEKRKEWGITTVIVNKRGNACPKCLPFVGKVLIDDVWSGGKQSDGPYMLMSYAMAQGLYHPRCKDVHTTYFEGISTPGASYTKEELAKIERDYRKEQKQQYEKRQAERFRRLAEYSLDEDNQKRYERKADQWKKSFLDGGDKDDLERVRGNVKMTNHDDGQITYEIDGMRERSQIKVKECYSELMNEYNSPLKIVRKGADGVGTKGDTDLMGVEIGLNTSNYTTMAHEFLHTLANTRRDKYGFSNNSDFWKEIEAVRREYNKAISQSSKYKISAYASQDLDEFTAEAFAQYRTIMKGEKLGWEYGEDTTYSKKVTDIIDKYFKKKSIENIGESGKIVSGGVSGARNPFGDKAKEHAQRYYGLVRSMKTDVSKISKTVGMSEDEIQAVKNFVFLEKHDLGGTELEYFEPDYMMAESWQRLVDGKPEQHDITLLKHELLEKELIDNGMSQQEAHIAATKKYNYDKEAIEFYGKIKKYRKE